MGCGASKPEAVAAAPAPADNAAESKQAPQSNAPTPAGNNASTSGAAAAGAGAGDKPAQAPADKPDKKPEAQPSSGAGGGDGGGAAAAAGDSPGGVTPKRGTRRGSTANGGKTPGTADPGTASKVEEEAKKGAAALARHLAGNMQDEDVVILTINAMAEVTVGDEQQQSALHVSDGSKEVRVACSLVYRGIRTEDSRRAYPCSACIFLLASARRSSKPCGCTAGSQTCSLPDSGTSPSWPAVSLRCSAGRARWMLWCRASVPTLRSSSACRRE